MSMNRRLANKVNLYETSDIALASALSLVFPVEKIDKHNPKRAIFKFKDSDELRKRIGVYWQGKLKVSPLAYFNQLKTIKSRLYAKE